MYPVCFQEINEENNGTQCPGQRIGPENYIDNGNYFNRYTDIGNTDDTPAAHHNQHGDDGFSCAAQDTGHAVGEGQQKIEECYGAGLSGTKRNHLWIIIKSGYQYRSKPVDQKAHEFSGDDGTQNTETGSLLGTVILAGAQILADEGGHGHGEAGDWQKAEALDFGISPAPGHGHFPKTVDISLHNYIGNGYNGILETGRQAVLDDLLQEKEIEADFPEMNPVILRAFCQEYQAQDGAGKLGNNGSQGRASHAEAENAYKQQIQQ